MNEPVWQTTFLSTDYQKLISPCVYAWFRKGKCLYIGSTGRGLIHIYNHTVIGKLDELLITDEIRFIWLETLAQARRLERELLTIYNPFFNSANTFRKTLVASQFKPEK